MNFGRTGPSVEVGVRKRLRKRLRRFPDLDELRHKMERNKGYGERSKITTNDNNIMHVREDSSPVSFEVTRVTNVFGNVYEDKIECASNAPPTCALDVQVAEEICPK